MIKINIPAPKRAPDVVKPAEVALELDTLAGDDLVARLRELESTGGGLAPVVAALIESQRGDKPP